MARARARPDAGIGGSCRRRRVAPPPGIHIDAEGGDNRALSTRLPEPMKPRYLPALLLAALTLPLGTHAQTRTPAKSAAKPSAKATATAAAAAAVTALAEADPEQLLAASMVLLGRLDCEFDQKMVISRTPGADGYVDVEILRRKATFKPVRSATGALRLEQVNAGDLLLVQIPTKTIVMDTKAGKRLVDGCQQDEQKHEAALAAAGDSNRLGINAPGQMQITGTPASKH